MSAQADLLVLAGDVWTADPVRPRARGFAVREGRIVFAGGDAGARALAGPSARVVDARDAIVLPGLIDSHGHVKGLGLHLSRVDLGGTKSFREVVARAASAKPVNGWVIGRGWDQNAWPSARLPQHSRLSTALPEVPVLLRRVDGHAAVVNARALAVAGITRETEDPPGGRILRDKNGEPTGVLIDNAIDLVAVHAPAEDAATIRSAIERAQTHLLSLGLTMVGDAGIDAATLAVYRAMSKEGALTMRVHAMIEAPGDAFESALEEGPWSDPGGRLSARAVKLFADGALGSRGAALLSDYEDDPGNSGLLLRPAEELEETCRRAAARGFQPCVHAIGDRANRIVLDIYERLLASHDAATLRPRIEHAQVLAPEDIPRFGGLGVIASMQPVHCTSDMPWAGTRLGAERLRGAYAWRSLLKEGARIAAGSDFPVESADPLAGLYAAVTRHDRTGREWSAHEGLTFEEALASFTTEGAWAAFAEDRVGRLSPGMNADFVVVEGLVPEEPESYRSARVRATFIEGTLVAGAV